MKKYKPYIIGILLLLIGLSIGWLIKPNQIKLDEEQHAHLEKEKDSSTNTEIWTCSMHPQIRQNEPGICPICEMELIPLDNSGGNDNPTILKMSKEAAKLAQVETFIVGGESNGSGFGQQKGIINVDGTIALDERTVKSQTAHLSGRIEQVNVTFEGQYVERGQQIASLYSTELLAASQELITASQYDGKVEGLVAAAKQKLKNWKITDNQIQQILDTKKPIETISIYADHNGYVLNKFQSQGDYVKQGQVLYTVGTTYNLWVIFNVFESDLEGVKKGSKIHFTTPSLPQENFVAYVSYIDPMLNEKTRTATVRAEVKNTENKLKPGMLLNGKIELTLNLNLNNKDKLLKVPNSAILWTGDKSVVYVQIEEANVPTFEFREVVVVRRNSGFSEVSSGIKLGDKVVTQGAFAIDAAAQLSNKQSMMNRDVSIKKETHDDMVPSFKSNTPNKFKDEIDSVIFYYISLKDALVETNSENASKQTEFFINQLGKVEMNLVKGEAHLFWMEKLKAIKAHANLINESKNIEEQRSQFDFLSRELIEVLKAFGVNDKTYYIQYCPMAIDNKGADWISDEEKIRNPYFGDKMLKCGSVKLIIN